MTSSVVIIVPEPKRIANLVKHRIDLADFEAGFSWDRFVVLSAHPSRTGRAREMFIGTMAGRIVAAIVSPIGSEALAIVSIRIADANERAVYDAKD